jgi:MFS transporter, Spinster family, sphingosine-1-phosphate transporter
MNLSSTTNSLPDDKPLPGANAALFWLLGINLFNYIDRQILSAVLTRLEFDGSLFSADDPNVKSKLGLLTSAFLVAYMIVSPIVGWLDGHGYRRWIILGVGVTLWSIASGSSGFAVSYAMLFATRCLIGVGEGAYGPVASAMLADIYPARLRGTVMALFNMAIPVGSALGFAIGGLISGICNDWRPAFWFTFLGLIMGVACLMKSEFPRPQRSRDAAPVSYFGVLDRLRKNMSFVFCCVGMTAITFVIGGVAAWVPAYVFQREARFNLNLAIVESLANPKPEDGRRAVPAEVIQKLTPKADGVERPFPEMKAHLKGTLTETEATQYLESIYNTATTKDSPSLSLINIIFGGILVLGGLSATAVGGWLGEKLRTRVRGAYFHVIGWGALFALPCYLGLLYVPFPYAWGFAFLAIFGLFFHVGPGFTILANVVTSEIRATAFAVNILVIHALGDVISPPLIGIVADAADLQTAFLLMSGVIVLGGVTWIFGARYLESDTARAEGAG